MHLHHNTLKPAIGSKKSKKRLGRGTGSGWGKTAGRGHKGQHARKGGFHKLGFEGGQTPLQRSRRKFGFHSMTQHLTQEIRLSALQKLTDEVITYDILKKAGLLKHVTRKVKIIATGTLKKSIKLVGLAVTAGAKSTIESLGGTVQA